MISEFHLNPVDERAEAIVTLRDGLFHESLWHGEQPGTVPRPKPAEPGRTAYDCLELSLNLHALNVRLILALLGVKAKFISTPWSSCGHFPFE
ncbi:MAG: hypothetical protein AB1716_14265 [Planctomycetota bacterium]